MSTAIKVKNLSVVLDGKLKALDDVSLEIPSGKIIGFIGPSGAGKTTLIRAIVGNVNITSGTVRVLGKTAGSKELRHDVSYMAQDLSVYADLTVAENLKYFISMVDRHWKQSKELIKRLLELVDMTDKRDSLVSNLSGGQKQRVSLAIALIGSPKLLLLDEPTVGLDPVLRESIWKIFRKIAKQGVTIIMTSHSMDEASRCDDIVLLRDGRLIAHSSPAKLLEHTRSLSIEESFLKLVEYKK